MSKVYVEKVDDTYRVAGSRVSLDSVVYAFLGGQSPESIVDSFPTLSLEQVYGVITFYLSNRDKIDAYLNQGEEDFEALRCAAPRAMPTLNSTRNSKRRVNSPRARARED